MEHAHGGNKTRKLEYVFANALESGADCIITMGGIQSNHVKQTVSAALTVRRSPYGHKKIDRYLSVFVRLLNGHIWGMLFWNECRIFQSLASLIIYPVQNLPNMIISFQLKI